MNCRVEAAASIRADPKLLDQLFVNLMKNATEHGRTDGLLSIEVGVDGPGFYIEDDGAGLPADPEQVFETGFTTKGDGTGIGLAIVRQVAEAHGWTVEATESDAGGARFVVEGVEFVDREDGD